MAMIETGIKPAALSARAEERFLAPGRANARLARSRFVMVLAVVLAVHAAVLGWLLYRDSTTPDIVADSVETPVEVVVEPPPEPKKPPPEQPKPEPEKPKPSEAEKPAESAPRRARTDTAEAKDTAADTAARKTPAPPRDGQPAPTEARTPPAKPDTAAASKPVDAKAEDDKREAEALDKATPDPARKPDAEAKVAPKADPAAATDAARQLATMAAAPTPRFAAAGMAQFPEGQEDNRYLAVVYGMVMGKNRYLGSTAAKRGERGVVSVSFVVDPLGNLRYQGVVESSGQADLDALAMSAVRAAAPFPPPPGSGATQLVARMSFGLAPDDVRKGTR